MLRNILEAVNTLDQNGLTGGLRVWLLYSSSGGGSAGNQESMDKSRQLAISTFEHLETRTDFSIFAKYLF